MCNASPCAVATQFSLATASSLWHFDAMCKNAMLHAIEVAVRREGSRTAVAKRLGLTRQALDQWKDKVPPKHVLAMEEMSDVSRYDLRPDIYGPKPRPSRRSEHLSAA
jgi:DNA-binding transcriptional regulator YdaS (Cro superfamily)